METHLAEILAADNFARNLSTSSRSSLKQKYYVDVKGCLIDFCTVKLEFK